MAKWYFSWVKGLKGPEGVKFDADISKPKDCLIVYKLNDDEKNMTVESLMLRFPYKEA